MQPPFSWGFSVWLAVACPAGCGQEPVLGVAGGAATVRALWGAPLSACVAGAPLPIPPDLLPKAAYDPVTPAFYVSLWDALSFLELVSAS